MDSVGDMSETTKLIMAAFLQFSTDLYTSLVQYTPDELLRYLQSKSLPFLTTEVKDYLISADELEHTHNCLCCG